MLSIPPVTSAVSIQLLLFSLDGQRYGLELPVVERVVRAVELEALPGAPKVIRGIFSLSGALVPVGDLRRRLGLPERDIALSDCIVIVWAGSQRLGVLVDGETDVVTCAAGDVVPTGAIFRGGDLVEGVAQLGNGIVLVNNLAKFLTIAEQLSLREALDDRR